jgi:hypothetical protein
MDAAARPDANLTPRGFDLNLPSCETGPIATTPCRWIEGVTGWQVRKFVRAAGRYRTIEIRAGARTITAANPCPTTSEALDRIHRQASAH